MFQNILSQGQFSNETLLKSVSSFNFDAKFLN